MAESVTIPPPAPEGLNSTLLRNIEALKERQAEENASAPFQERLAGAITNFTGSMGFVYVHAVLYGFWIVANLSWLGIPTWDETFVVLAMIASVEAIFLSTFILISQNRMALVADRRAELDLQIGVLAEHEITKLVQLVSALADRMQLPQGSAAEIEEMKRSVAPEAVLEAIEERRLDNSAGKLT